MRFAARVTGVVSSLCLITSASSASFPPTPEGVTVLKSTKYDGVSISYKQVSSQKQYFLSVGLSVRADTQARPKSVRPHRVPKDTAASSTSLRPRQKGVTTKSTCSSGSSRLGTTPTPRRCRYGSKVDRDHPR